jgi:DNA-binding CsgD family transcriptional regulator
MQSDSSRTVSPAHSHEREVAAALIEVLFESSMLGIAVCDRELRYLSISKSLARMNGLPVEQHIGRTVKEILGPAAPTVESLLKYVLDTGQAVTDAQITGQLPGRDRPGHWLTSYFPIRGPDGSVQKVGGLVVEISPQVELKRLMESAIKVIKDASGFADTHDDLSSFTPAADDEQTALPFTPPIDRTVAPLVPHQDDELSTRETELVVLLANSKSNKEISMTLGISVKTVETYRHRLMLKLDIHSVGEIVKYALRHGLIRL